MSDQPSYWVILRRDNGHAMTVRGTVIEIFPNEDLAKEAARALAHKFHGVKYSIGQLTWSITVTPQQSEEKH